MRSTFCTIEANYWQTRSIARPLCESRATCSDDCAVCKWHYYKMIIMTNFVGLISEFVAFWRKTSHRERPSYRAVATHAATWRHTSRTSKKFYEAALHSHCLAEQETLNFHCVYCQQYLRPVRMSPTQFALVFTCSSSIHVVERT